jgi:hypothetical protein
MRPWARATDQGVVLLVGGAQGGHHLADGVVHVREGVAVQAARGGATEAAGSKQRGMGLNEGIVEKERPGAGVAAHKADRLGREPLGQGLQDGRLLHHLRIAHDKAQKAIGLMGGVAQAARVVGEGQAIVRVKAMSGREKVAVSGVAVVDAEVPLAHRC